MGRIPKKSALPNVPKGLDVETRRFLLAVKEAIERYQGLRPNQSSLDEIVTMRSLQNLGFDLNVVTSEKQKYDFSGLI